MSNAQQVAVIGIAGRFPGACNTEQLWLNLRDGVESIAFPDDAELLAAGVPARLLEHPGYVRAVASAPDVENFDAPLFGYTPRDAENSDPQIRMFLESAHAALENAGYNPYACPGSVGVYASTGTNRYIDLQLGYAGDVSATSSFALSVLNYTDYLASTVSYKLGLRGPAITLSTACSSSLVTVHLASQALRNGECDVALAGGVEVEMPLGHGYLWDEGGPMSRDGHVRPFDVAASGTMFGTGVGVVVLKRLADALADGDTVLAVIRGSAINNDGSDKAGFSAPSIAGQAIMLTEAMTIADAMPADISYVECHATGTQLGDPIEVAALDRAFATLSGGLLPPESCALSSLKGNLGHLGHAAGVASLIKVVLALRAGQIPATANFTEPNPGLQLGQTPFYVTDGLRPWPRQPGRSRCAGVSSFGIGGTNAHVVLEEPPPQPLAPPDDRPRILVWSARGEEAERAYRSQLHRHLRWKGEEVFPAAASTLQEGRRGYPVRRAVVAGSAREAVASLGSGQGVIGGTADGRQIAFVFPGQGSQQTAMGAGLYATDPAFADALDEVFALFAGHGVNLPAHWRHAEGDRLADTGLAQPLLFSVEYALARMLAAWGIRADAVLGHSLGELSAAAVAGVFTLPDAVSLVQARARAMRAAPPGGMLAVALPEAELADSLPDGLAVAVVNGPGQTVLAGPVPEIEACQRALAGKQIACSRLKTSGAFHSPLMAAAAAELAATLSGIRCQPPGTPLYSAASGGLLPGAEAANPGFWAAQVAAPVRFDRAIDALLAEDGWLVLEVGPGDALSALARSHPAVTGGSATFVPVLPRTRGDDHDDLRQALHAAGLVWAEGHDLDWRALRGGEAVRRVPLPGYQYQRRRHWADRRRAHGSADAAAARPDQARPSGSPFGMVRWQEEPRPAAADRPADADCLLLAPAAAADCMPVIVSLQRAALRPVVVRPGAGFGEAADGFTARPGSADDLSQVLAALAARGIRPPLLVHALTATAAEPPTLAEVDGRLDEGIFSLLALLRAGARSAAGRPGPAVLVITAGSADVTGAEPVDPARAALHGFARSVIKAAPNLACRVIDVAEADEEELAAEIALWPRHQIVALRGSRRWEPRHAVFEASPARNAVGGAIRRQGVYLLAGGLGGLGMAVARAMADTGLQPRLALLSRRGLAPDMADDRSCRLRAQIAEIEARGAQVRTIACDVTDRRALRRALDTVTAAFGPVHGVVQLAGVPGDGLVYLRTAQQASQVSPDDVRAVLAAKVHGTLALAELLDDRPPVDFFAIFSSRAATDGLLGSGDYAAANAYQDAYAAVLRRRGVPALSINWPYWAEVGMAAEYGLRTWSADLAPDNCPALDEHRIDGEPVLPGAAHIDLLLRGYRALTGNTDPVRLRDIVFHQMMGAPSPRRLEVRLYPDGRLETWARPLADPAARLVRHASARLSQADQPVAQADPAALRSRLTRPVYEPDEAGDYLFRLGPRWDNVTAIWATDDASTPEMLVELALPGQFAGETSGHVAHPALLDSAITAARRPEDGAHLPLLVDSLDLYRPLPGSVLAHVRRDVSGTGIIRADVDLLAADGTMLARIRGCTLRKVGDVSVSAPLGGAAGGTATPAVGAGIEPQHGARLFLQLLASRHPGQVLVERDLERAVWSGPPSPPGAQPPRPRAASAVAPPPQVSPTASAPGGTASNGDFPDAAHRGQAQPGESLEERLTVIWADVIGDPQIGLDADFFELGGNSLSAVSLMSGIAEAFSVDLSLATLFDHPTIRGLTQALKTQGAR